MGDCDRVALAPWRWSRLLYGESSYATTTFLDSSGRRCALRMAPVGAHDQVELAATLGEGGTLRVHLVGDRGSGVELTIADDTVTITRPDRPGETVPLGVTADGRFTLRLLLDTEIAEVFTPAGAAFVRIAAAVASCELTLEATVGRTYVDQLEVSALV